MTVTVPVKPRFSRRGNRSHPKTPPHHPGDELSTAAPHFGRVTGASPAAISRKTILGAMKTNDYDAAIDCSKRNECYVLPPVCSRVAKPFLLVVVVLVAPCMFVALPLR